MDRFNINSQIEHLQARYVGTGHADTTRHEWANNQHRDSFATYIGHTSTLHYLSLAEGESIGRMKFNFTERMLQPCGPPPPPKPEVNGAKQEEE
jgi:splicing factor 3B subunit 5